MFLKSRSFHVLVFIAILIALSVTAALAALPAVRTYAPGLSAGITVDGSTSDWITLVPANSPPEADFVNPDWASFLCNESQGCDTGVVTGYQAHGPYGDLLLRFQCPATKGQNGTLYGLYMARPNNYIIDDNVANFVKYLAGTGNPTQTLVRAGDPTWAYGSPVPGGYQYAEWSGSLAPDASLTTYSYTLQFHEDIYSTGPGQNKGNTAGTGDVYVTMTCSYSTAVALSTFEAHSNALISNGMVIPGIATVVGLLAVAGLLSIWRLRSRTA